MTRPRISWLALALLVPLSLSGCRTIHHLLNDDTCNKPQPYQSATSIAPLNIPPGLAAPDTNHALDVPNLDTPPPPPRSPTDPCLAAPPSFNAAQPSARPQA
ncbi:MAG TPA: hypothetical protein VMD06_11075 [Steroidobacteraceae bacterium]|nr:hypothetical protein [Steroidobacteraceae bacterium]